MSKFSSIIILLAFCTHKTLQDKNEEKAMEYLHKYGYMESMDNMSSDKMQKSIILFQEFNGMKPTGVIDNHIMTMMEEPRCGNPDLKPVKVISKICGNLNKKKLTYKFLNYTKTMLPIEIRKQFAKAVEIWTEHIDLTIKPTILKENVDINIFFANLDGPLEILALVKCPQNIIVFDLYEKWAAYFGVNFFQTAVHELGHVLGMEHMESNMNSVMFPSLLPHDFNSITTLSTTDRNLITRLYKKRDNNKISQSILCYDPIVDTVFTSIDNFSYVFKKDTYWKLTAKGITEGPTSINTKWPEISVNIDAAFTFKKHTYFFKGRYFWKYDENYKLQTNYPKLISKGFPNIPSRLNAVFQWKDRLFFFKGYHYWVYDTRKSSFGVGLEYPAPISDWDGVPDKLDAVTMLFGKPTFFKGGSYYVFDEVMEQVEKGYPKYSKTELFKCK